MNHSSARVGFGSQCLHFILNALVFTLCYLTANQMASQQNITRHIALPIDRAIGFVDWMIIPYLSSGLFFSGLFFLLWDRHCLRLYSQRLMLATLCATFVFMLWPLHFSLSRPALASPWLGELYHLLGILDQPYNQFPSLHVAYCLIFWPVCRSLCTSRWMRLGIGLWLLLVACSTVLVFQHHLLDVLGGLLLGALVIQLIQPAQSSVGFFYLAACLLALLFGVLVWSHWLAWWFALCFALVSCAYYRQQHHFLRKQGGQHSWLTKLIYAPYLAGYLIIWHFFPFLYRHTHAFEWFDTRLLIGRRLTPEQAKALPADCVIIDLSCELSEAPSLRHQRYLHFPILDLCLPDAPYLHRISKAIHHEISRGATVYLHCAMGLSRCRLVAGFYRSHYGSPYDGHLDLSA